MYIAYFFLYVYLFWLGFLMYASVMNYGWGKLPLFQKILLTPPGLVFLVMDVAFNCTFGCLLFLQLPTRATITLSKRMAANIRSNKKDWRYSLSKSIVDAMLLPFTPYY